MKFIDRSSELKELESSYALSKNRLFSTIIYGMRRVGKTELVKEFMKNKPSIYFFVYDNKTSKALLGEFEEELKRRKIIDTLASIDTWEKFIDVLFDRCRGSVIIFDEFQNFRDIYPAFFSMLQKKFDENKNVSIHFIFLGSIIGLIKKTFEDMKAPLYGRIKTKMKLSPLSYMHTKEMLSALGYSKETDAVEFYSVFGGMPKYYVAIEDFELERKPLLDVITFFFLRENAPFGMEVLDILRQEFGKRKGTYYTILEAIATGHTKLNEIATYAGLNMTSITRYLSDLVDTYEVVERSVPVTEDIRKSRKGIYKIRNPVMAFWFRHIHKNLTLFEIGNFEEIRNIIKNDITKYHGRRFENISKEFLWELNRKNKLQSSFSRIGNWWGMSRDETGRKAVEIDLIALSEETKQILFCECKWQDLKFKDAEKLLENLKEKSTFVEWNKTDRKEYFGIIAKMIERKEELRDRGFTVFDLEDFSLSPILS
jgi:AAA+ ATPase superfamily predicted ATPase